MRRSFNAARGFSLLDLLVTIAIIAILAALMFPSINRSKARARQVTCLSDLRQINTGVHLYSNDSNDASPNTASAASTNNIAPLYAGYKQLMKNYVGLKGPSSPKDRLFACPADTFYPNYILSNAVPPWRYEQQSLHDQPVFDYSSYVFNGGDNKTRMLAVGPWTPPGLTGLKLSAVKHPARTVLVTEASALIPWSWHNPVKTTDALPYNDAKNVVSYVDGHVRYTKIYWNSTPYTNGGLSFAFGYDPPESYDYQWSAN